MESNKIQRLQKQIETLLSIQAKGEKRLTDAYMWLAQEEACFKQAKAEAIAENREFSGPLEDIFTTAVATAKQELNSQQEIAQSLANTITNLKTQLEDAERSASREASRAASQRALLCEGLEMPV